MNGTIQSINGFREVLVNGVPLPGSEHPVALFVRRTLVGSHGERGSDVRGSFETGQFTIISYCDLRIKHLVI